MEQQNPIAPCTKDKTAQDSAVATGSEEASLTSTKLVVPETFDSPLRDKTLSSPHAIGYHAALALKLTGRHAKLFAEAFANEYEKALANELTEEQAHSYAIDFAGPYAIAFTNFVTQNSQILSSERLFPDARQYALSHLAQYEPQFRTDYDAVLLDEARLAEERQAEEIRLEKIRLEKKIAQEKHLANEKKKSQQEGYNKGYAEGKKRGGEEQYKIGRSDGYQEGHELGMKQGFEDAISKDYEDGLVHGSKESYKKIVYATLAITFGIAGAFGFSTLLKSLF